MRKQFKNKLIEQLNLNLDFLLNAPEVKQEQIEQLLECLALIDQCIDQTMLLTIIEELDGQLPRAENPLSN
ncbi:hypothetical protein [Desulfosporosinus nitroreducens]|uniref:Spo0E like sporulation regulatory protein n=1 Tax=Desulfosporosinus nitroreducens TaxID=2018668 RepID=A0ABT8QUK5_9FIRM|nr:hypothetical protein [Desulfosporosinus nitroreducens]MCO1602713.1 hypothetical protein [Desulfosporosinus nitroreducens]MDO0823576.1 hypothetical protein [Desulfosporosinus nitroreducens]